MYVGGLRIGEVIGFHPRWIDARQGIARVIGKGDKERIVPLPGPFIDRLRAMWLTHRNPTRLFATCPTSPLYVNTLNDALHLACEDAGLPRQRSHVLRHSYATRLLERGVSPLALQLLMGHQNLRTTMGYLHLTLPLRTTIQETIADLSRDLA